MPSHKSSPVALLFAAAVLAALATSLSLPLAAQSYIFGRSDFAVGNDPAAIAMGDFNDDGIMDLVVTNANDNTISILLGRPDGSFNPQVAYTTGPTPLSVAVGDFNGDGNLDVAVVNANCSFGIEGLFCGSGTVGILLGKGDGTFLPTTNYAVGSVGQGSVNLATGDFNADGKLDLVVTNGGDNTVSILLGNGDGAFQGQITYATAGGPESVVVGDFNGDGKLDLAVACDYNVSVLLGNGNGAFGAHIDSAAGGSHLVAGDFNRDGRLDLAVIGAPQGQDGSLAILLSNGDGTFVTYATYPGGTGVSVADLNGDGNPDLLVYYGGDFTDITGTVTVELGNGDGTFRTGGQYGTGVDSIMSVAYDFTGDGKQDIAVVNSSDNSVSVLLGFGDGTFVALKDYAAGAASLISADFTGDGKPDLAATFNSAIEVLPGNGDGTFRSAIPTSLAQVPGQIVSGDFNDDGRQDIATVFSNCNNGCLPGTAAVLMGNGDGTFQPPIASAVGLQPEYLVAGDFNNDGKLDLAVTNFASSTISVLLGNGDGTFRTHVDYPATLNTRNIIAADLNHDGNLDLIVLGNTLSIYLGNGDGTFRPRTDYPYSGYSVVAGDFNSDGILDLAVGGYSELFVVLGNGDGTFQAPINYPSGGDFALLASADFNGDHKLDLAAGHNYSIETSVILGNGDGTFQNPANYVAADRITSSTLALDLNGDGAPDLANSDEGTNNIAVLLSSAFKAVSPSALNFGSQGTGTASAPRTLTISNPSNVTFSIENITASGNFAQSNDCGSSLTPGSNCAVSVTFTPTATGVQSGAIMITDSTRSSPQSIALIGAGVNGPFLTSAPASVDFLPQNVGAASNPTAVQIENTGNATLNINGIAIGGLDVSDFSQTNNCGNTLSPGGSCTVQVTFSPTMSGVRVANVSIADNASGSPQTVVLTGTGLSLDNTLTVTITGGGKVSSTDGFIDCPVTCSHSYPANTPVTLQYQAGQQWNFQSWSGNCNGYSCVVDMSQNQSVGATFTYFGVVEQFVPVTPCRVVDTRNSNGPFGGPPIPGRTSRDFPIPQGGCNIPPTATAYSLNVTVVPPGRLGFLTIWPAGLQQPEVSLMNSLDGRTKANAAIVQAGVQGAVSVYVTDTTNLLLDIDGYFAPAGNSTLAFYPLTPCRIVDTRNANGDLAGPFLIANQERDFPVLESACIPQNANAAAYSFNVTAVPHPAGQRLGFLTIWPQGQPQPGVSTLNNLTGTIVANAAVVPAGANGAIAVFPNNSTDLLIDINGYFAAPGQAGLSLYSVAPCRVLDTRGPDGNVPPFMGELTVNVAGSPCALAPNAQAFVLNATAIPPSRLGFLTLWPDGQPQPQVSTLNAVDGAITSNMAIVPTVNGSIDAYANGLTQLLLDISGYFGP